MYRQWATNLNGDEHGPAVFQVRHGVRGLLEVLARRKGHRGFEGNDPLSE